MSEELVKLYLLILKHEWKVTTVYSKGGRGIWVRVVGPYNWYGYNPYPEESFLLEWC